MTTSEYAHYINHDGRRLPVRILERYEYAGGPMVRVRAARPVFQTWTHGGWALSDILSVPAGCVHELYGSALDKLCARLPEYADEIREVYDAGLQVYYSTVEPATDAWIISQAFAWNKTPQGFDYWLGVLHALEAAEQAAAEKDLVDEWLCSAGCTCSTADAAGPPDGGGACDFCRSEHATEEIPF